MVSNINTTAIDATYPVAGKPNDTQGFRDNFLAIKNNFQSAKSEIEELQSNNVKTDQTNDFSGNTIADVNLTEVTEKLYGPFTLVSDQNISFLSGNYQKFIIGAAEDSSSTNILLTFADWPANGRVGRIRLEFEGSGNTRTITFNTESSGSIVSKALPSPFIVDNLNEYHIIDVWSSDNGETVFLEYIGEFT